MDKQSLFLFLIILVITSLAGCTGTSPGTRDMTAEKYLTHTHEVRSYSADVMRTYSGEKNGTDVFRIRIKNPDRLRMDFLQSTDPGPGAVQLILKNISYLYRPADNQVIVMPIDDQDWVNGISWAEPDYWRMTEKIAGDAEISLRSCGAVDGKTYCLLGMRPRNPQDFIDRYRSSYAYSDILVQVDAATMNPVNILAYYDNGRSQVQVSYRNLTVDPDLSDDPFAPVFPHGATVITPPTHEVVVTYPGVVYPK
jgi:outer membrane lipoprotein-sorting protein